MPYPRATTSATQAAPCRRLTMTVAACLLAAAAGCTRGQYKEWADHQVYKIIDQKNQRALGKKPPFTIEPQAQAALDRLARKRQPLVVPEPDAPTPESLAPELGVTRERPVMNLDQAVELAIWGSRDYQTHKENLYLAILALTAEQHQWSAQLSGLIAGGWERTDSERAWIADSQFGVSQMLATGGALSLGLSGDFLRKIDGDPKNSAASLFTASLVQPLWRGAGQEIAQESLTQAERDAIYAVRDFAHYHRTFAVEVATGYYAVQQRRLVVGNEWANFVRRYRSLQRAEMMAKAGRMPQQEVDQTRQDELNASNRFISTLREYQNGLDSFKVQLGLPPLTDLDVDPDEMHALLVTGTPPQPLTLEQADHQALALRMDLITSREQVEDAGRKVKVAANGLAPDLNLVGNLNAGNSAQNQPLTLGFGDRDKNVGLELGLPLDRFTERNTYRSALIALERAKRDAAQLADNIRVQIARDWRALEETRQSFDIQRESAALARRRVEGVGILLAAGRAISRDLLEAQQALVDAENALSGAMVNYVTARLQLWRDMETLQVGPTGALTGQ